MEKRVLLAIILSLMVLYIFGAITPRKRNPFEKIESLRKVDKKGAEVISLESEATLSNIVSVASPVDETTQHIENKELIAEFSNIGGKLKRVSIKKYMYTPPITDIINIPRYEKVSFVTDWVSDNEISYSFKDSDYEIVKRYKLLDEDFLIRSEIEVHNISKGEKNGVFRLDNFRLDNSAESNNSLLNRDRSLLEYAISSNKGVHRKGNAYKFSDKEKKEKIDVVKWIGFRDRYFCLLVKPLFESTKYLVNPIGKDKIVLGLEVLTDKIESQATNKYEYVLFVGPQKLNLLKSYNMGFEEIMVFSNFSLIDYIAKIIYKIMHFLHKIIPNWGICIILISFGIYGATYPLTIKGMSSMKKMQSLQPKMAKLREQHKNNPQKLNKEIMELYSTNKINPFAGCLPFIFQMPIFIGLYQVLWRSVSFKGSSFLWIKDLSEPDRLAILPFHLPVIGNEFNLLPILMIIVMFFQQKLSSKNMVVVDPAQAKQQKMMMFFFPLFLGFIFYKFASGMSLYFTIFYLLSTLTQWKMSKMKTVS